MEKPDVDAIEGLSPAISIDQKTTSRNPRSTVGTVTEIHDYLRLLYARIGVPHCPKCGKEIRQQTIDQMVDAICTYPEGTRMQVLSPIVRARKGEHVKLLEEARKSGFVRVRIDGEMYELDDTPDLDKKKKHTIELVIDRLIIRPGKEFRQRLTDSLETACNRSGGTVLIDLFDQGELLFSQNYACPDCGISIEELAPRMFSFNSPFGACPTCSGLGTLMKISPDILFPNKKLSLRQGALNAMGFNTNDDNGIAMQYFRAMAAKYGFTLDTPVEEFSPEAWKAILYGTGKEKITITYEGAMGRGEYATPFEGVIPTLQRRYEETSSDAMKQAYEEYMAEELCPDCHGQRLKPEALAVTVGGKNLAEVSAMSITDCRAFFQGLTLTEKERMIATQILKEINARLGFLVERGPGLSDAGAGGGDALRRRGAAHSAGDADRLSPDGRAVHSGRAVHRPAPAGQRQAAGDAEAAAGSGQHADRGGARRGHHVRGGLDRGRGPRGGRSRRRDRGAGHSRGYHGLSGESLTGQYLSGAKKIAVPAKRRKPTGWLKVIGAQEHNLKNIDVKVPLGVLCCVTGVSGSGKSSLVNEILYKHLAKVLNRAKTRPGKFTRMEGVEQLDKIICIDQSPIGRTPRCNPATYTGIIRSDPQGIRHESGGESPGLQGEPLLLQCEGRPL